MSDTFWLSDGTNTLILDNEVTQVNLGNVKREFSVKDYIGADGGILTGTGNLKSRKLTISRKEKAEDGDQSAWNSRRTEYLQWFMKNKNEDIYLYIRDGEDSFTVRTLVYCDNVGNEKYKYIKVSDDRDISLVMPAGILENTTVTSYTGFTGLSGFGNISLSPEIGGINDVPGIWSITPNATLNTAKIWIGESIGFTIAGPFDVSNEVIYDHRDNTFSIAGVNYSIYNYLQSGGRFVMPAGTDTIYYYFSASVDLELTLYERYI